MTFSPAEKGAAGGRVQPTAHGPGREPRESPWRRVGNTKISLTYPDEQSQTTVDGCLKGMTT